MANKPEPQLPASPPLVSLIKRADSIEKIKSVALPSISRKMDVWLQRAIVEISQNQDLVDFVTSNKGQIQFITKLAKAAQSGLEIGGVRPHVYFIKLGEVLRMDITKEGYTHAVTYGPGAILSKRPDIYVIHQNDKFHLDMANGIFEFSPNPFDKDRGPIAGYVARFSFKETSRRDELNYVTMEKVNHIRDKYSNKGPAWEKSEDEMNLKIATKYLLKPIFGECEGIAMLINSLSDSDEPVIPYEEKTVSDRAVDRLTEASGLLGEVNSIPTPEKTVTTAEPKTKSEEPGMF